jgi:chemotaxis protein histidine kinase CheA
MKAVASAPSMEMETIDEKRGKELQKFGITDTAIAEMGSKYLKLTVKGIEDKAGLASVHSARMDVVKKRTSVEAVRKELKEDVLTWGRMIDTEAKRITELLAPIEDHLSAEERKVTEEIIRIKREKEEKEKARIQARINRLFAFGCRFDGSAYSFFTIDYSFNASQDQIKTASDEQFEKMCSDIQSAIDTENARAAEIERQRKEEDARLAKIREEQEAERKRLEAIAAEQARKEAEARAEIERQQAALRAEQERIAKEQAEKERKVKADQEAREVAIRAEEAKIAAEKKAIEDAKIKAAEEKALQERIEKERIEAMERARAEEAERIKKEAAEKAEKERLAKIEAERQEALRPDKEKLLNLASTISGLEFPKVGEDAAKILADVRKELNKTAQALIAKTKEL